VTPVPTEPALDADLSASIQRSHLKLFNISDDAVSKVLSIVLCGNGLLVGWLTTSFLNLGRIEWNHKQSTTT
jgi:hypothetical protein